MGWWSGKREPSPTTGIKFVKNSEAPVQQKETSSAQRPPPVSETEEVWCKPDMSCLRSLGEKKEFQTSVPQERVLEPREATRCSHKPWSKGPEYRKSKQARNKHIWGIWCMLSVSILTDIQTLEQLAQRSGCLPLEMLSQVGWSSERCPGLQQWGCTTWSLKVSSNPNKIIIFMISYFSTKSLKFSGSYSLNCD